MSNGRTFDDIVLEDLLVSDAIQNNKSIRKTCHITNTDRSSFARISGVIASKYGDHGFQGRLRFDLTGASGQSFCAFLGKGMEVTLTGYGNDYVGKGMAGGKVTVVPPIEDQVSKLKSVGNLPSSSGSQFSMVGNTVLYGATGGNLFVRGRAGERFAVYIYLMIISDNFTTSL